MHWFALAATHLAAWRKTHQRPFVGVSRETGIRGLFGNARRAVEGREFRPSIDAMSGNQQQCVATNARKVAINQSSIGCD
jgi:hypothetical protein